MRLLFFGTPGFAVPTLQALIENGEMIVGAVTQPDRPKGRNQKVLPSAVKEAARQAGLPVLQPVSVGEPAFLKTVRELKPDLGITAAYGQLLPKPLLDAFPKGVLNLHASLLPKYRGAAPVQWALIQGERETGVTIFQLDEKMDHGPIWSQARLAIDPEEAADTLTGRLAQRGAALLIDTVKLIRSGREAPQPQDHAAASFAPALKKADGLIDWNADCITIHNRVRGVQPWPGAAVSLKGKLIQLLQTRPHPETADSGAPPGTPIRMDPKRGLWFQTGQGALEALRVKPEGKAGMSARDYCSGIPR
ncbi:MAG: methionyl-tRNA formyltransferase [Candidatus Omnitrophica bacterium CG11_big_fil_rev_8_21_14_0_20_64_10]|nr:MAG: methionyl-tRNA formyltransferase [Candidatus Omnitrophica bacterium CG11_big_fil_rev_8_21_14_0_20_64_10]